MRQGLSQGRAGLGVPEAAVLSSLAVTTRRPSGLKDAEETLRSCGKGFPRGAPVSASQKRAVCRRWRDHASPVGLKDAEETLRSCGMGFPRGAPVSASRCGPCCRRWR